ncbi:erythroblast NAD(P)(+)--arginine ADP-ribosyltransferase-like [Pseudopipra pipra]|uniref:erythroblast NAD(P)(+)--arginine ADP-ribosyltransferase-like n=1 Tax=Pseudopipra pipra TaxID=415032 RepID=UPI00313A2303
MELLLLLLLAVPSAIGIKELALDMAPDAFDDQYQDCSDKMVKELLALNRSELGPNSNYSKAWDDATVKWHSHPSLGSLRWKEEAIALLAYTLETDLYKEFNRAVPLAGSSRQEYLDKFHFKVLHFLLTTALEDLRGAQTHPRCLHVFRGVQGIWFIAQPGDVVRFGQFTSSSLNRTVAEQFGTDTLFELDTCHGANIQDFSFMPWEEEVLIPPFETFNVTRVTHQGAKTHIQLRPHGVYSKHNCVYASVVSSGQRDPPHLGGLLLAALPWQWPWAPPEPRGHRCPLCPRARPSRGLRTEPPVSPGRAGGHGDPPLQGDTAQAQGTPSLSHGWGVGGQLRGGTGGIGFSSGRFFLPPNILTLLSNH